MTLAQKLEKKITYNDYLTWSDDERWELIEGAAYNMSPAPSIKHQRIVGNFHYILKEKLKGKPCSPFIVPVDVVLSDYDVVQPDIFVVCDKNKITQANIQGAPDLVIEVRSPYTALKDMREKKALYEKYGVREYVIVDPLQNYVERFHAGAENKYGHSDIFGAAEVLPLFSLAEIEIPLSELFELEEEAGSSEVNFK